LVSELPPANEPVMLEATRSNPTPWESNNALTGALIVVGAIFAVPVPFHATMAVKVVPLVSARPLHVAGSEPVLSDVAVIVALATPVVLVPSVTVEDPSHVAVVLAEVVTTVFAPPFAIQVWSSVIDATAALTVALAFESALDPEWADCSQGFASVGLSLAPPTTVQFTWLR
jgi:hypothetical protein